MHEDPDAPSSDAAAVMALRRAVRSVGDALLTDPRRSRPILLTLLPDDPELAAALAIVAAGGLPARLRQPLTAAELRAETGQALRVAVERDGVPVALAQRAIGCWVAAGDASPVPMLPPVLRPAASLRTGPTPIIRSADSAGPSTTGRVLQIALAGVVVIVAVAGGAVLLTAMRGSGAAAAAPLHRLADAVGPVASKPDSNASAAQSTAPSARAASHPPAAPRFWAATTTPAAATPPSRAASDRPTASGSSGSAPVPSAPGGSAPAVAASAPATESTSIAPSDPAPPDPSSSDPSSSDPSSSDPAPSDAAPSGSATDTAPSDSATTDPAPSDSATTDPAPSDDTTY